MRSKDIKMKFLVNKIPTLLIGMLLGASLIVAQNITRVEAAPLASQIPDVDCYPFAQAEGWTSTRCYDWSNGDVCIFSSSGMQSCKFEGN